MNLLLFGIIGYILLQLFIGYWVSKKIKSEDDYLLAGRKLGYWFATFSIFATWFGAESCIGSSGAVYRSGLKGALADPLGYTICLFLFGMVFAKVLWGKKIVTIGDFFKKRYSPFVEKVAVLMIVPASLLWAGAQIKAFGQIFASVSNLDITIATLISTFIVIAYTMMGGLLADVLTDFVQGIVLVLGLVILFFSVFMNGNVLTAGSLIKPEQFIVFGKDYSLWHFLEIMGITVCGSVVAQELISRVISARSGKVAQRSSFFASFMYFIIGLIPVFIGLAGVNLLPKLSSAENVLLTMAKNHLSAIGYLMFTGALVSAILSTVDSSILACTSLTIHNVILPLKPQLDEKGKVKILRFSVMVFGLIAYFLALSGSSVYELVKEASSFGSGGIFVVMVFGLFTKLGGVRSALSTIFTGVITWIIVYYVLKFDFAYLITTALCLGTYIGVSFFEKHRVVKTQPLQQIPDETANLTYLNEIQKDMDSSRNKDKNHITITRN